jgi:biotin operon repressor
VQEPRDTSACGVVPMDRRIGRRRLEAASSTRPPVSARLTLEIPSTLANGLTELRQRNRLRVLEALRCGSPLSPATISRLTGLSRSTVWTVVRELKHQGLISEQTSVEPVRRGGRPSAHLLLNRRSTTGGLDEYSSEIKQLSTVHLFQIDQLLALTRQLAQENARLQSLLTSIAALVGEVPPAPSKRVARRKRGRD